uniref:FBD domain-containing protein n=1 Tax=Aegilops tauschii subsp. strangulata TaxID=200361 RepID=A0A452ZUB6_AEGTS
RPAPSRRTAPRGARGPGHAQRLLRRARRSGGGARWLQQRKSLIRKDMKNAQQYDVLVDPLECLDLHLRAIVVNTYRGLRPDINFAKFFVLNAKALKVMKFGVSASNCNEQWMPDQRTKLQLDNSASRDARFDFERYNSDDGMLFANKRHTHDMWIADPFDSSLCKCCGPF